MAEKKSAEELPGVLHPDSLESGAAASKFVDAPDKDDDSQILQVEILPGEKPPKGD